MVLVTYGNNRCSVCGRVVCCCYCAYANLVSHRVVPAQYKPSGITNTSPVLNTPPNRAARRAARLQYAAISTARVDDDISINVARIGSRTIEEMDCCHPGCVNTDPRHCSARPERLPPNKSPALEYAGPVIIIYDIPIPKTHTPEYSKKDTAAVVPELITLDKVKHLHLEEGRSRALAPARCKAIIYFSLLLLALCIYIPTVKSAEFRCDLWAADIISSPGFLCLCPPAGTGPDRPVCVMSLPSLPNRECHGSMVATCEGETPNDCRTKLFEQGRLGGCFGGICMLTDNCV